jgi:hypothetical protein
VGGSDDRAWLSLVDAGGETFLFEQVIDRQAFEEAQGREGYE